jgi:hypothetical protein
MGIKLAASILLILVTTVVSFAQSVDVGSPTPVRSNTVSGKIAVRDLGDSRLTDHYFAFTGTPGDLLITIQSTNLNGDLDVFTAVTLRPLLKLSLYAESTTPVTKGIYLRKREDLILRIEARSPNDDPGTYRLYFGGSFEPLRGGPDIAAAEAEPSPEPAATPGQKGRRVSSVGARIEEPAPPVTEVAAAPTPAPTPEPTPEAKPVETPKPAVTEKSIEEAAKTTPPPRNTRVRRPAPRRQPPPPKQAPPTAEEPAPTVRTEETKRTTEEPKPKAPAPEPEPEVGPRLIIETNDGTLINRSMSTVKRVTIENGMVVVTGKDGKISRMLLINVVRMQIQP